MVEERGPAVVSPYPEVNFARLIQRKHSLTPPVDVLALVKQYADVIERHIPIQGVDGVTLDLKVKGRWPKVVINSALVPTRRLFTLAHELGHIIIPWHIGTIPDLLNYSADELALLDEATQQLVQTTWGEYSQLEQEANRFASELLMPETWIEGLIAAHDDLAALHQAVCNQAGVSPLAACIRLRPLLPPGIVHCCFDGEDLVVFANRSDGTFQAPPVRGTISLFVDFAHATQHTWWRNGTSTYHWWQFPLEVALADTDPREWRLILDTIVAEKLETGDAHKIKQYINAIIGAAHGSVKNHALLPYSEESLIAACIQRFDAKDELWRFSQHSDFKLVIKKRAAEIFARNRGPQT